MAKRASKSAKILQNNLIHIVRTPPLAYPLFQNLPGNLVPDDSCYLVLALSLRIRLKALTALNITVIFFIIACK